MQKDQALEYRRMLLDMRRAFDDEDSEFVSHLLEVTILAIEEEFSLIKQNGDDCVWPLTPVELSQLN